MSGDPTPAREASSSAIDSGAIDSSAIGHVPVILVTIMEDRNLGHALSASDYLTKPFDRGRLEAVLQRHTARHDKVVLVALHRREEWRDVPVVVITAKELSAAERELLAGETEKIIEKGAYTREELLGEVRRLVQIHRGAEDSPSSEDPRDV